MRPFRFAIAVCGLLPALSPEATAATLRVGPGQAITRIADAARLAQDGDTVEVLPGEYRADVAIWKQKRLTLRGLDPRPVLIADGKSAEDKAIWVVRNGDITIDNFAFQGARVRDGNGAGVRFEKGRLTVRNCVFEDNQNGILTANFPDAELIIRDSRFANAPHQEGALPHLLYVGRIARVEISGSRFHTGYRGHLIKSRARQTELRYNLIYDGEHGQASYEIDLPNAGIATLVGNVIGQSARTGNPIVVSYGEEGHHWPINTLTLVHNTLISEKLPGAWFLRVPVDTFATPPTVIAQNNLTVGPGVFSLAAPGRFSGNFPAFSGVLANPQKFDFRLSTGSLLRGIVERPDGQNGAPIPGAEFALPLGTHPLTLPTAWTPGAYQSPAD